jgi:hypothetical protein
MDESWRKMIVATHSSGRQAVLAITGGGTGAISELLRVPGASKLVLEAVVPYDGRALEAFLGAAPAQACSGETAVAMAARARERAAAFGRAGAPPLGLGATASLATDRPHQGEHRCHIAVATGPRTDLCSIVLAKGRRDRAGEEDLVARAVLLWLARACGVEAPSPRVLLDADEPLTEDCSPGDPIGELLASGVDRLTVWPDGTIETSAPPPRVVFPGSFNPVHAGHRTLARVAEEMLGAPAAFEISVVNVDKPPLSEKEVRMRLAQFRGASRVELTRAPTFVEKSRIFPGATFVVGADTAERLVAARYYGGEEPGMTAALREMADRGCRFLVAVRLDRDGRVQSLADVAVPPAVAHIFTPIPENRFRLDASSSAIRAGTEVAS